MSNNFGCDLFPPLCPPKSHSHGRKCHMSVKNCGSSGWKLGFMSPLWHLDFWKIWRIFYQYPYCTTHGFQNNAEGSNVTISDCVYYRICSPQQKIRQGPISGFNYREMSINTDGNTLHKLSHRCLHLITLRTFAQANDCKSCTSGSITPGTASPAAASDIETHLAGLETV
jgi:hypothetical protein